MDIYLVTVTTNSSKNTPLVVVNEIYDCAKLPRPNMWIL